MVNIGLNPGAVLGIVLFGAGAGLYFLRSVRPELARDHDIFFMAVAVLSGGILFFQGWRLDPILTFGQLLLTGSAIFFAVESIRLRGLATSRAKQNTPIIDEDRPISRAYTYEGYDPRLDQLEPEEDARPRRMIGTREDRYPQGSDHYEDETPRRSSSPPRRRTPPPSSRAPRRSPSSTPRPSEGWETPGYRSGRYDDPYGPTETEEDRPYRPENPNPRPPVEPRRSPPAERPRSESNTRGDGLNRQPREPRKEDYVDFEPMAETQDDSRSDSYGSREDQGDRPGSFDY